MEKNCEILYREPLSKYSYMRTGGIGEKLIFPLNIQGLKDAIKTDSPIILGNCSNVIFSDEGIKRPIVITTKLKAVSVYEDGDCFFITAEAGASLNAMSKLAYENSLSGLEFAHGIPGTIGGAVFMNAGAYGGEIKDIFVSCVCIDRDGNEIAMNTEDLKFSYRYSILQDTSLILASATFKLKKGDKAEIKGLMDELMMKRKSKQPLEYPSVGSFFKRPEGNFAAKLIEDAGLKGFSVGGASVSEKHSGFVINKGNATTKDILDLASHVKKTVYEKFGIMLEEEARMITD